MRTIQIEFPTDWVDYELIDTGDGMKLERYGSYTVARPDPRIIWHPLAEANTWRKADATFIRSSQTEGHWDIKNHPPVPWSIRYQNLVFTLHPTEFKHTGIFPEQAVNWNWVRQTIAAQQLPPGNSPLHILNLFAYTGGATMAALSAGAKVTHVDSVKGVIDWAGQNLKASALERKPVRFIIEDAYKFALRETRRGNTYEGIILDPPRFGRGSKGEVWKLEHDLPKLLGVCRQLLSPKPRFVLINVYTADISPIALENLMVYITKDFGGTLQSGELALMESYGKRLLPNGIFCRWSVNV